MPPKRSRRRRRPGFSKKQVQAIKRIARADDEVKSHISLSDANTVSTTTELNYMSGIVDGDTYADREGNVIKVKSVTLTGYAELYNATTALMRHMVIRWFDDTTPTAADIFANSTYPLYSQYNVTSSTKYKVVYDRTYMLNADKPYRKFYFNRKYRNRLPTIKFTGGSSASEIYGVYYEIVVSDGVVNLPRIHRQFRIRYIDP